MCRASQGPGSQRGGKRGERGNWECFFCFIMFTDPELFCSTSFDERAIQFPVPAPPTPPFPFLTNNKLPQAGWLKTKEPYSVTVLHTSSLNQGVSSVALRENPVPACLLAFGHCLEVSSIFWFINTPFQSLPVPSHCFLLCVSLC